MRDIVLQRLANLKNSSNEFQTAQWTRVFISCSLGKEIHVSKIEFEKLNDAELLNIFVFLMKQSGGTNS